MRPFFLALLAAPLLTSPLLAQADHTAAPVKKPFWVDSTNWAAITESYLIPPDGQEGPVLNKPFSAIEVRHSPHRVSNGKHHTDYLDTNEIYRDTKGRMRIEGSKILLIFDPVINKTYALRREEKDYKESQAIYASRERTFSTAIAVIGDGGYIATTGDDPGPVWEPILHDSWGWYPGVFTPTNHVDTVDLGTLTISGALCRGTRVTLTIPALDKKNDIHVFRERWYSDALQALVEGVDVDPRFGMSTYELKDIKRGEPDPSLFKLPDGYTPTTNLNWTAQR